MIMRYAPVVFALALMGGAGAALAQSSAAANETPQQNVRASQQYQQLVCSNAAFRAKRIAQECGSLQGSQFYDSCVASFNCNKQPSDANWNKPPPSETIK
jgi:recombinational DNA repair protein (RecF pathway)